MGLTFKQIAVSIISFPLESVSDMRANNDFEKSVFALLDSVKNVKCTKSFQLTAKGMEQYKARFHGQFFTAWRRALPDGDQPKQNAPGLGSSIEMDCLAQLNENTSLVDVCK